MKINIIITMIEPSEQAAGLFRRLFPACPQCAVPGWDVLLPAPGIVLQLCGPGSMPPAFLKVARQPVISYVVDDLKHTISVAIDKGAVLLLQSLDDCSGFRHSYVQFPGEQVVGFFTNCERIHPTS